MKKYLQANNFFKYFFSFRIGSGKQNTNVIVDNGQNSEDEDDIFVVEDSTPAVEEDAMVGHPHCVAVNLPFWESN